MKRKKIIKALKIIRKQCEILNDGRCGTCLFRSGKNGCQFVTKYEEMIPSEWDIESINRTFLSDRCIGIKEVN